MAKHRPTSPRPRRAPVKRHARQSSGNGCLIMMLALVAGMASIPTVLILAAWHVA